MATDTLTHDAGTRRGNFWREHSLTIMILAGMVVFAIVFWFAGLETWQAQQRAHRAPERLWPDYVWFYLADMSDSLFGSLVGALAIVQGTKYFRERGKRPSKQDKSQ